MPVDPLPSFATRARPCERILHPCPGASRADVVRALIVRAVRCSAAITCVLTAAPLHAQRGSGDDERPAGLLLSDARDVRVTVGGYLQADVRAASARGGSDPDGVLLRRARLTLDAEAPGGWLVRLQPDFGQGRAQIQDGYVAWSGRALGVRAGRFRPAFGVERTQSSATLLFPERSLLNAFMPSRLFGAQGVATVGRVTVSAGAFGAAGVRDALVDTDGDPVGVSQIGSDAVVRAVVRLAGDLPERAIPRAGSAGATADTTPARGGARAGTRLELHLGAMTGRARGDAEFPGLDRFLTAAQRPALGWREEDGTSGTVADGARRRAAAGALLVRGGLHASAEAAWFAQAVRLETSRRELRHSAATARASWLWGGTRQPDLDVRPRGPRGALELGARVAAARLDRNAFLYADPDASADALRGAGVALAWIPRDGTRLAASYDLTRLAGATSGTEHALIVRLQQGF